MADISVANRLAIYCGGIADALIRHTGNARPDVEGLAEQAARLAEQLGLQPPLQFEFLGEGMEEAAVFWLGEPMGGDKVFGMTHTQAPELSADDDDRAGTLMIERVAKGNPKAIRDWLRRWQWAIDGLARDVGATPPGPVEAKHAGASGAGGNGEPKATYTVAASVPNEAMLSCADLARIWGVESECLRGRLRRWREKHPDADGWQEVPDRTQREAGHLYRVGAVRPILDKLAASGKTSGKRPA